MAAIIGIVLTVLGTIVLLIASGGDDEPDTSTVPLSDVAFDVDVLRIDGEPLAVVRNGGQVQVLRLVGPDGAAVGYCDAGELFVSPDAATVYDIDGVHVAGPGEVGLERFVFELLDGEVKIDTGFIEEGAPVGFDTELSAATPEVQSCVASADVLEFAP